MALSIGVGSPISLSANAQATPTASETAQITPVFQQVLSSPRWFTGSDSRVHLVYELALSNPTSMPVTITGIDVLDLELGRPVASLTGASLNSAMSLLSAPEVPTTTLPAATIAVVWLDISLDNPEEIPAALEHRITASLLPGLGIPTTAKLIGGATEVDQRAPFFLGPPIKGAHWLVLASCCDGPDRRAIQPINGRLLLAQRFAVDFSALDADGRLVSDDPTLNTSYASYGQPVIAVADGTVVAAIDQFPDQTPNDPALVGAGELSGNHVILDLGNGYLALYAHLKAESVAVEVGDIVEQGQLIGELGNSGSSATPHLHFQVMDAPSSLAADGLPYVFDQFELIGRALPLDAVVQTEAPDAAIPVDTVGAGPRTDALPLRGDVVAFAEAAAG